MRVLITGFPQVCHLYPLIPYARALELAGHEVVVACPPGAEQDIVAAGLATVNFGTPVPPSLATWAAQGNLPMVEDLDRLAGELQVSDADRDHWDVYYQYFLFACRAYLPEGEQSDVDGLVRFAQEWQPDLVLWDSWFPLGGIVARVAGAAHARILIGPDYGAWASDLWEARGRKQDDLLAQAVRPVAERFGLTVDDDLLEGQATVDPLPARMNLGADVTSIPVRWAAYNAGAVKPEWLHATPERPRIALSLGLSTRAYHDSDARIPKVLEALADLDVEVVATLTEGQLKGFDVPDNVRVIDYVPLTQLLSSCTAIIHHGSSGTFWAAQAAGIPQLVTDTDEAQRMVFTIDGDNIGCTISDRHADSWLSAAYVSEHGAGGRLNHETQSAEDMRALIVDLLENPSFREGAAELQRKWRERPSPSDIVPQLEKIAALHTRGEQA